MHRQVALADDMVVVDACPQHGNGMGFYIPEVGWNSFNAQTSSNMLAVTGTSLTQILICWSLKLRSWPCGLPSPVVTGGYILRGTDLRSQRLTMLLEGYAKDDDVGPLRFSQKIPVTYPIVCVMRRVADTLHGGGGAVGYARCHRSGLWLVVAPRGILGQNGGDTIGETDECKRLLLCLR